MARAGCLRMEVAPCTIKLVAVSSFFVVSVTHLACLYETSKYLLAQIYWHFGKVDTVPSNPGWSILSLCKFCSLILYRFAYMPNSAQLQVELNIDRPNWAKRNVDTVFYFFHSKAAPGRAAGPGDRSCHIGSDFGAEFVWKLRQQVSPFSLYRGFISGREIAVMVLITI